MNFRFTRRGLTMTLGSFAIATMAVLFYGAPIGYDVQVVDVVLPDWNHDTDIQPEPAIAVDLPHPDTIALSAYALGFPMPTDPQGTNEFGEPAFCGDDFAGLLMSFDGGSTWHLRCPLPKDPSAATDLAIDFTGDGSALVASYIAPLDVGRVEEIRKWKFYETTAGTALYTGNASESVDQPFVVASPNRVARTFSVGTYQELAGCTGGGVVRWWNTQGANGVTCVADRGGYGVMTVRTAQSIDGRIYGLYLNIRDAKSSDLVLVRGTFGEGATDVASFADLKDDVLLDQVIDSGDPCAVPDGNVGQRIRNCVRVPEDTWAGVDDACHPSMGLQVRNPNQLAVAIDPNDSRTVYLVYGARPDGATEGIVDSLTLHLAKWSDATGQKQVTELLTVSNALNPALAITASGRIGFAYQQFTTGVWQTHLRISTVAQGSWQDFALTGQSPQSEPPPHCDWGPYLGDYMDIAAAGEVFYGTFSFDNNPDRNPDAVYLRDKTLLGSGVDYSIDPFFYKVSARGWSLRRTPAEVGQMWVHAVEYAAQRIRELQRRRPPIGPYPDTVRGPATIRR